MTDVSWLKPPDRRVRNALAEPVRGFSVFLRHETQQVFYRSIVYKMPVNMKGEAPPDANLKIAVATCQAAPTSSTCTPSTIQRADIMSQYTYSTDSLRLRNTPSSAENESADHTKLVTKGLLSIAKTAPCSISSPNFGGRFF